jgi:hypothetical protein
MEGEGRRVAFEELAVELEDEQGAGVGLDGPEGAEDVGDAVAEEGADESDVFSGDGLVSGEGGFATGEGDQAVVLEVDRSQILHGEPIGVLEGEGGLFGVLVVVVGMSVEVKVGVVFWEGGLELGEPAMVDAIGG